jgi:hypothetical protein
LFSSRLARLGEAATLRLLQHHAASGPADARARARYYLGAAYDFGWLGLEASAPDAVREYEQERLVRADGDGAGAAGARSARARALASA